MDEWSQINGIENYMTQRHQLSPASDFDPYQILLKRKEQNQNPHVMDYDETDVFELQQFCQKHGIMGFNLGKLHPKAALSMLRKKMGILETAPPPAPKLLHG